MERPSSVDAYLAEVPEPFRAALEHLRRTILAAAPGAVETISYGMPAIRLDGRDVVSYAAFRDHCSLFPMSGAVTALVRDEVGATAVTGKGTIRFDPARQLADDVVERIVRARIAENAARPRPRTRRGKLPGTGTGTGTEAGTAESGDAGRGTPEPR